MLLWQGNIICSHFRFRKYADIAKKNNVYISHFRFRKFYYDSDDKECLEFTFGGCEGNGNRFSSIKECELVCLSREEPEVEQQSTISKVSLKDICSHTVFKAIDSTQPMASSSSLYRPIIFFKNSQSS